MAGKRYIGYKEESAFGTKVTVDKFSDLITENVVPDKRLQFVESARTSSPSTVLPGLELSRGAIAWLASTEDFTPYAFKWHLGSVATTNPYSGVYQHVITPGDSIKSFSLDIGAEQSKRSLGGCLIESLTLEAVLGRPVIITAAVGGFSEAKATIGTPSYSTVAPFNFTQGAISIAGGSSTIVRAFRLTLTRTIPWDTMFAVGYTTPQNILLGPRTVEGTMDLSFVDFTEYDRFRAAASFVLQLLCEGAVIASTYKHTLKVYLSKLWYLRDVTPHIDRQEPFDLRADIKAQYDTSSSYDAQVTIINSLSTI